jgi:site-specific DNA-cytosine methylase
MNLIIGFSHTQGLDCQPSEKHWPTLRKNGAGMAVLIIDGTRVGDVRIYDDEIMQTVIQRWGTGGGNVPYVFPIQDGREMEQDRALGFSSGQGADSYGLAITKEGIPPLKANAGGNTVPAILTPPPSAVVRRLTPTECERLQGFPDNWTADQADSNRYKQMGNAVTVNVIQWIGARL